MVREGIERGGVILTYYREKKISRRENSKMKCAVTIGEGGPPMCYSRSKMPTRPK